MDDLEFRRRAYAEPNSEDRDFLDKKNESADNAHFVDELKLLDQKISEIMHIDPPEGLAERIQLNQTLGEHVHNKNQYRLFLSIAASALIVMSLVFTFIQYTPDTDLSKQLVNHVYDELHHLDNNHNYTIDKTNLVLAAYGARLSSDIGRVKYVGKCRIDNQDGVHMVLHGKQGAVTVMVMPNRNIDEVMMISDQRFQGSIESTTQGSLAIIAEKGEQLDNIRHSINNSLKWKI